MDTARLHLGTFLVVGLYLLSSFAFAGATFQALGTNTYATMSRNGQYVVIIAANRDVYTWSAVTGQAPLGLNVGTSGSVSAITDDATVVAGYHRNALNQTMAFRWTAATGFVDLGDLPGGSTFSVPYGMSADGNTIVGESASTASGTNGEAFRWTPGTGIVPLGDLPGGSYFSRAASISADGSTIAGISNQTAGYEAFRWTQGSGMVGLGDIPGGFFNSQAYKISSDGNAIVGYSYDSQNREHAFRWTQASGLVPLGITTVKPNEWSQAHAVSLDGNVIVGNNNTGVTTADIDALIWDPAFGMRHLQDALLADHALSLPGWKLNYAWNVSDNGMIIAGSGTNPSALREAWIVTIVPEPGTAALIGAAAALFMRRKRCRPGH